MPSNYVRKTVTKYSKVDIAKAVEAVRNDSLSIEQASKKFNIPRTTLQDHVSRVWENKCQKLGRSDHVGAGRPKEIDDESERYLVEGLQYLGSLGWPVEAFAVPFIVKNFLDNMGVQRRFKNNLPGREWTRNFLKRNKEEIRKRKPEYVTVARAKGLTTNVLSAFFSMVKEFLDDFGSNFTGRHFYNLDETGLSLDPKRKDCLFKKGSSNAMCIVPTEGKTMYTVLFCGNAEGEYLPPYVIYKGKGQTFSASWIAGAPTGTVFNVTPSGWMEDIAFENWFEKSFLEHVKHKEKPIFLFFDGHNSHLTFKTILCAKENDVHIICLPPQTSFALQPLDVGVFGPAKSTWQKILQEFYTGSRNQKVSKESFASLLNALFERAFKGKPQYLVSGNMPMMCILHCKFI